MRGPPPLESKPSMPLAYERDDRRRRLIAVPSGTLTLEHCLEFLDRQAAEGTWSYAVLYDGRARTAVLESAELVRLVSRTAILSKQHGPPGALALVRADAAGIGSARMFEIFSDQSGRQVGVFTTIEEAEAWLNEVTANPSRGPAGSGGA